MWYSSKGCVVYLINEHSTSEQQRKYTAERYLDPIIIGNHFKQEPSFIRMEQLLSIKKRNL